MKEQISIHETGIQIDNTLSMALQKPVAERNRIFLLLLAFLGIFSSIFAFLSMFMPNYSFPWLTLAILIMFAFFAYVSTRSGKKCILCIILSVLVYCILFFRNMAWISNGFMHLTNAVCQAIYMTDWQYFEIDSAYDEIVSVTCALCFLIFPIVWMLCYAVLRYQNFFLSFLMTFPLIEIGLFFGIAPNHLVAAMLVSFWFAMASVQLSGSGILHSTGKSGFFRKKNAFFPVSNMRFMLSERTGIAVFLLLLLLFMAAAYILSCISEIRPERIKSLRTDFQNYVASLNWTDGKFLDDYGDTVAEQEIVEEDENTIALGAVDGKTYENISVSSIVLSEIPESRIYLKYRSGDIYNGMSWTAMPDEDITIFEAFETLNYEPSAFLYYTVPECYDITLSLYYTDDILSKCVPYGFQQSTNYIIHGGSDYETIFLNYDELTAESVSSLLDFCYADALPVLTNISENHEDTLVWSAAHTPEAAEAAVLCGSGYSDFVSAYDTELPDTLSMTAIQTAYADLFADDFDAETASPAETIQKLQEIRNAICQNVSYTLSPGKTPSDKDHAAYFLLENHKGYCEHYATAGTILARMAGIPARYCEGYMIDCHQKDNFTETVIEGENVYVSQILDSNAHAWTEVYLNGIGWIPFEFTFSYFDTETQNTKSHTPEATASTHPTTEHTQQPEPVSTKIPVRMLILLIVLFLSAICCFVMLIFRIARLTAIRKREKNLSQQDKKSAAKYAYQYLSDLMEECGVPVHAITIGELILTSEQNCSQYTGQYSLSAAVQLGAKHRYSPHPVSGGELQYLCQTANALANGMYQDAAFFKKFYLKWMRHYL